MHAGITKNKLKFLIFTQVIFFFGLFASINSLAEIYKGEDENGKVYFGDKLPENSMKIETIEPGATRATIKGDPQDSLRNIKQAQRWYEERLKQSKKEDKKIEKQLAAKKREYKKKKTTCKKYRKEFDDKKIDLKARKHAGIKPKKEKQIRIKIEQLKRDVDYYC